MGERHGIDDKLLAAAEQTRAKLRRAAARASGRDDGGSGAQGHTRHGDRGSSTMGAHESVDGVEDDHRDDDPAS